MGNSIRIELLNGCSCCNLNITPQNWETKNASIDRPWLLSYRFYDNNGDSKPVQIRGMNAFNTLKSRQKATRTILDNELHLLKAQGYNPITKKMTPSVVPVDIDYEISPNVTLDIALQKAYERFEGVSKLDVKSSLKYLTISIQILEFDRWKVKDIKKRHLLRIIENCKNIKGKKWSNNQFNHYRSALMSLYRILEDLDTVEYNPVHKIRKKKHLKKLRQILTEEQRSMIDNRLKKENYRFWNFIHIFYHSGSRLTEISRLQRKYVDLNKQTATYLVKKGGTSGWVKRPIPDVALPYWEYALKDCGPNDYIFAKGLKPGKVPINSSQYTIRWRRWIKQPVMDTNKYSPKKHKRINWLDVDIYALKHTRTTELADKLAKIGLSDIDKITSTANGHTTPKMVQQVYDVHNASRKNEIIKRMDSGF